MKTTALTHPYFVAFSFFVLLVLWMLSGYISSDAREIGHEETPVERENALMQVEVLVSEAAEVSRQIVIQGQLDPLREVELKVETAGKVAEILAQKGQRVSQGEVILVLAMNDRQAKLEEARSRLRHFTARLEATKKLVNKGYVDEVSLMEIEAAKAGASAEVERMELEIRNTRIVAPFAGIVNERIVEIGAYVGVGDVVATLVDDNTMLASGYLPQQSVGRIKLGQEATARLFSGEELQGTVRYISAQSANESRTFRVEVEVPNPDHLLSAGISTMLNLSAGSVVAHFIPPSVLSLGDKEQLGVKVVDSDNRVMFYPVDIVRTELAGLWVSGLPEQVRMITMGQGFVNPGDQVIPVNPKTADAPVETTIL